MLWARDQPRVTKIDRQVPWLPRSTSDVERYLKLRKIRLSADHAAEW